MRYRVNINFRFGGPITETVKKIMIINKLATKPRFIIAVEKRLSQNDTGLGRTGFEEVFNE